MARQSKDGMMHHMCDMQNGQDVINGTAHGDALFSVWAVENMYGQWRDRKGWLCADCRMELNARLPEEQPQRKRAHGHRTREVEEVME